MNKLFYILLGTVWGLFGLSITIKPVFYHSGLKYTFDFTEVRWPFGLFLILLGVSFIYSAVRRNIKQKTTKEDQVLICKKCLRPIFEKDTANKICPTCGIVLENIEGFYDRHPEIKNT